MDQDAGDEAEQKSAQLRRLLYSKSRGQLCPSQSSLRLLTF